MTDKERNRERNRRYRERHCGDPEWRARNAERTRRYYANHKSEVKERRSLKYDKINARRRQRRAEATPEQTARRKEQQKLWQEKYKAAALKWAQDNRDKRSAQMKAWRIAFPDRNKQIAYKHRSNLSDEQRATRSAQFIISQQLGVQASLLPRRIIEVKACQLLVKRAIRERDDHS